MDFYKNITGEQLAALIPFGLACGIVGYHVKAQMDKCCGRKKACVNPSFQKGDSKVAHSFDIEDIGKQAAFCRCWRSSKFPYCDGTHNKYNAETGDNVGPLIIKKKE